jgi:hypothetical protein
VLSSPKLEGIIEKSSIKRYAFCFFRPKAQFDAYSKCFLNILRKHFEKTHNLANSHTYSAMFKINANQYPLMLSYLLMSCGFSQSDITIEKTKHIISIHQLKLDTLVTQHPNASFQGFFALDTLQKNILFLDHLFATATVFDYEGRYLQTNLGKGQGPNEVKGIQHYIRGQKNHFIFNDWNTYTYNLRWQRTKISYFDWNINGKQIKDLENNPQPDQRGVYEVKYTGNKFILKETRILFNIESSHPRFNGYFPNVSNQYYKTAKIWALANPQTGQIQSIHGAYPSIYSENNMIPNFSNWYFDTLDDLLLVNFEADSLIYVYDKNFELTKAFGLAGKATRLNYRKTKNYDDAVNGFASDRQKYGYYYTITCFAKSSIVFRCYKMGTSQEAEEFNVQSPDDLNPMRMQIYQNQTLIGDVAVPSRFKIIGKVGKYYYADGYYDEEKGTMGVYRFSLENN